MSNYDRVRRYTPPGIGSCAGKCRKELIDTPEGGQLLACHNCKRIIIDSSKNGDMPVFKKTPPPQPPAK
jgi:hypothetical protein